LEDWKNTLYFSDDLDILRKYVPDESVDLIYFDPPFNSNATYNVLFQEKSGKNLSWNILSADSYSDYPITIGWKESRLSQICTSGNIEEAQKIGKDYGESQAPLL
jgi:16S rRNA G966 N2-methylase RsmD